MTDTKQQTAGAFVLPAPQYDKTEYLVEFFDSPEDERKNRY